MLQQILSLDEKIFLALNGWGGTFWDGFWMFFSEKWIGFPLVLFFLYGALKHIGFKRTGISILFIGVLILCSDQLANVFKIGFARPRPCFEPVLDGLVRLVKPRCGGAYGFFSAHAANSMSVALFMGLLLKARWKWFLNLALVFALCIGYSRIYIGVHYPLDVLFGFLVGTFFAIIGFQLFKRLPNAKAVNP